MKRNYIFLLVTIIASFFFFSCEKEEISDTTFKGTVVNALDHNPFPYLEVCITNGDNTYKTTHTDASGGFSLLVSFKEINSSYYLLVGDSSCAQVKKKLRGFGNAEIDLGVIEVEGPKPPIVTTDTVYSRKAGTVICRGTVADDGRAAVTNRGVCWSKSEYPTISDDHTSDGTGEGEFESNITGLDLGTIYYFRAYARNRIGISYGEQVMYETGSGKAEITTDSVYAVYATSAKCAGTIIDDSNFEVLSCGICWAMTPDPTVEDNVSYASAKSGHFECTMRNLEVSTTYYVSAFAENENGYTYAQCKPFITKSGKPIVSIGEPKAKATSIVVSGTIEDNGGFAITERGICYSTTNTEPTKEDGEKVQSGAGDGSFDVNIGGLEHSKTYYLRAYAVNSKGTSYSESYGIATKSGVASVTLNVDKSTITSSSVSSIVTITDDGSGIIQSCGVCWSDSPNPTIQGDKVVAGGKKLNTQYICNITTMEPNSTYYLRAYATTEVTTEYSTQVSITTIEGKPTVRTSISSTGEDYLVISGVVKTDDGAPITQQGICWSTIPNPTLSENVVYASGLSSPFSCRIDGLQKGTKYYCKAFAQNMYGTTLGNQVEPNTDYGPTTIKGHVYDQDGFPVSGVSVSGHRLSATTDQNGYYEISTNISTAHNYDLKASKEGYTEQEKSIHVEPGQVVEENYTIELIDAYQVDLGTGFFDDGPSRMVFECRYSSLVGQTTTRTMRIRNNRPVPISWSLQGVPSVGASFSSTSGTVPAKSEISVTVTFTYPTTSARMINLSGCASGTKAYLWNWENMVAGMYVQVLDSQGNWCIGYDNCAAVCEQNIFLNLDQVQAGFTLTFNQFITYK